MLNIIAVGLGGFLGSVLRYLVGLIRLRDGVYFPCKTLCINILGSFLIGLVAAYAAKHTELDPKWVLFWKVGICGGFTTFSSFALETCQLMQGKHPAAAALYMLASFLLSVLAVLLAQLLIK